MSVRELLSELAAMPEQQAIQRLDGLAVSLSIFRGNRVDLEELLAAHADPLQAMDWFAVGSRHLLDQVQMDLSRRLFNFTSAAMSLVDHSRNIFDVYETAGTFPDLRAQIDNRFANDPLHNFVKGLRNFCSHVRTAPIESTMVFEGSGIATAVRLPVRHLLSQQRWTALARQYLTNAGDEIDVGEVVRTYSTNVETFYDWVRTRLTEIHRDDLAKVEEQKERVRRAQYADVGRGLAFGLSTASWRNPDAVFLMAMGDDFHRFRSTQDPLRRCQEALDYLELYCEISPELRARLLALYERHVNAAAQPTPAQDKADREE